ncbi:glycosyltransferase [Reichenbachiella carrageenanivorans]|uniref:Glycosyltransferase n=1 Tax=Reichenbachiella carrageenanivorans TaxID=2979869 RepID=A0ABY6D4L9_9BACT|nr:glycosyltransferase [Reichenbachiella carrageenanivorans]UXX81106.1 glycosyltransferase [Reichenbachiella carrageenanivorans]
MPNLVSIIMPVYNAEQYVAEAIDSVLAQQHDYWELLIVNDGSTDRSDEIIRGYTDARIQYFKQDNAGVSVARNVAMQAMKGDYFCFLDGDDQLTVSSLSSRLEVFAQNSKLSFVDGAVSNRTEDLSKETSQWMPNFKGEPLSDLISLSGKSFFGVTWMIKRAPNYNYAFDPSFTHGEDLWFYIQQAKNHQYSFTSEVIYLRRISAGSAMSNLHGLANGYLSLEAKLSQLDIPPCLLSAYRAKRKSIMFKSYLRAGKVLSAFNYYFKT